MGCFWSHIKSNVMGFS